MDGFILVHEPKYFSLTRPRFRGDADRKGFHMSTEFWFGFATGLGLVAAACIVVFFIGQKSRKRD
jgi:hypothetical protein